jgi:hypothetical protein
VWFSTSPEVYNISLEVEVAGCVTGLLAGALASFPVTNSELKTLSRVNSISRRRWYGELGVLVLAFISMFLFLVFSFGYFSQIVVLYTDIGLAFIVSWELSKCIGFFNCERKSKKRLYFYENSKAVIYALPKMELVKAISLS